MLDVYITFGVVLTLVVILGLLYLVVPAIRRKFTASSKKQDVNEATANENQTALQILDQTNYCVQ